MIRPGDVRVHALLYGDHVDLHERLLRSLGRAVPAETPVHLWGNVLGRESRALLAADAPASWSITLRPDNVPKYRAMRELFREIRSPFSGASWAVWLDDDSWIEADDWFARTAAQIDSHPPGAAAYLGQRWGAAHLPGQWDFIRAAPWYRGLESLQVGGRPGTWFAQGAYWWLRADVLRALDWPDPRLVHNGGDTLLGEAVRQQGLRLLPYEYGVRVNDAPRRGVSDRPAGSLVEVRR